MHHLPTGTVTFLFTDIEGSTLMVQALGETFRGVLEEHNRVLRHEFRPPGGVEVRMEGDSFFVAFPSASAAIDAAVAGQRALARREWPPGGRVAVRMGMHTGQGTLGGADYVGIDVHRAARIAASGHGGQILVSDATRAAVDDLSPGLSLRDLGLHRFKDLDQQLRVHQVVSPDLPADFAPIRSLGTPPNNLPSQTSDFVGRTRETADLVDLVGPGRLVTLTGPGGTGKTRLGLHVAAGVLHRFADGAFFVPLDAVADPELVASSVAGHLGVAPGGDLEPADAVAQHLRDKEILLLLDNFEHVLEASPLVSRLRTECPGLAVLVTSQALLRIQGETAYPVPPLGIPEAGVDADTLLASDAAALFTQRAWAADPSFAATADNAATIASIVVELDGLPLALELAAARVRLFGLEGLLSRLTDRFAVLAAASRDAPQRHHTMLRTIEWSYELLDVEEQRLLSELSVFAGGFTLDAAEHVVTPELSAYVIEGIASLLDKSLIQQTLQRGEARFSMLRSILEFARRRLAGTVAAQELAGRHAEHFASLAEAASPYLEAEGQITWLDRLAVEHENIRAALDWCVESGGADMGLRIAGLIWRFYHRRGHLPEARSRLEALLAMTGASPETRAIGLTGLAGIVYWQGDYEAVVPIYHEALRLYRELGDTERVGDTLFGLSTTTSFMGDLEAGREYAELARQAYQEIGSDEGIRRVFAANAFATWMAGHLEEADALWAQAEQMYAEVGDRAEELQTCIARSAIAYQLGRRAHAAARLRECLEGMVEIDDVTGTIMALDFLAAAIAEDHPAEATPMAAAAARLRDELGGGLTPASVNLEPAREIAGRALPAGEVDELWARGGRMTLEEAVEYARSLTLASAP